MATNLSIYDKVKQKRKEKNKYNESPTKVGHVEECD